MSHPTPGPDPPSAQRDIRLGQRLRYRLYPLTLLMGVVISLGLPVVFYAAEYTLRARVAGGDAHEFASELGEALSAGSEEGRPSIEGGGAAFRRVVGVFLAGHRAVSIRVRDGAGRSLPGFEYTAPGREAWWSLHPVVGSAPLVVRGKTVGTVEVAFSQAAVVAVSAVLLLVSTAAGAGLAVFIYTSAFRAATTMDEQVRSLVGTLEDSRSESERLRAAAEESERDYRGLVQGIDAIVWAVDVATRGFVFVSRRAEPLLGYPVERWIEEPGFLLSRIHEDDRARVVGVVKAVMHDGQDREVEYRASAADGRVLWLRDHMHLVPDEPGRPRQLRGLITDVTSHRRAEEALERSREEYRSVVDSIQQVIYRTDARGRWTFLSAAWVEVTGFAVEESLGRTFLDFVHPEDRLRHAELLQPLMGGAAGHLGREVRYRTMAGGTRWMEVYARVTTDERERITGTFGTLTDVTERKQAEEELLSTRERLQHLLASSPAVIHSRQVGDDFPVTFVSENVSRLFGWEADELLEDPRGWERLVHPDDAPGMAARRALITEEGQQIHEYRLLCRDGTWRWVQDEWRVVRAPAGQALEVIGTVVDMTDRRQAEEARARLSSAVEQASDSIVITSPEGAIVYVNPAFERTTGHARDEVVGQDLRGLKQAEDGSGFAEALGSGAAGAEPWSGRLTGKRRDGSLTEEEAALSPVWDAHGRLVNHVALLRDVTRERRMEEQLRQSQKMEAVGQLAGGVAHDFNNLLTVITGRCHFLQQRLGGEGPGARDVTLIVEAAQRAAALTRQLLAFSRRQVLEMRVLDVNSVVAQVEKMLRRLIGEDIDLVTALGADLGCVKADPGQLEQVLLNLVVNARDAMPRGGRITIETGSVVGGTEDGPAGIPPGPHTMLAVSDNGSGMNAETLSHIFEPFFTTKGRDRGTGLGLATVYGIVAQSGGHIAVESEPGQGTVFRVYLPRVDEPADRLAPPSTGAEARGGQETILLTEDAVDLRTLAREVLTRRGYLVLDAADGAEALALAERHPGPIHLLLTDVVMPRVSGRELAEHLAAKHPAMKVLYMSGYTDDAVLRHGVLRSEVAFLQKPFGPGALARKVREILDTEVPAQASGSGGR
ncbi:MAG: PAS domain S-box protein [candidate division NC10 bacterium]